MNPPAHNSEIGVNTLRAGALGQSVVDWRLSNVITHWRFDAEEWRRFLTFDKDKRQKQDKREALVVVLIILLALLGTLFIGSLHAFAGVLILAGLIALGVFVHFFIQGRRQRQLELPGAGGAGEIYITPAGVWTNGVWFDWGEGTPWHLATVTPVLADMGVRLPPGVPSYLEFKCRGRAAGRYRPKIDKNWRVPVPRGKADEALEVVKHFGKPSATRDRFGLPDD